MLVSSVPILEFTCDTVGSNANFPVVNLLVLVVVEYLL